MNFIAPFDSLADTSGVHTFTILPIANASVRSFRGCSLGPPLAAKAPS